MGFISSVWKLFAGKHKELSNQTLEKKGDIEQSQQSLLFNYSAGHVSKLKLEEAIDFMISLEPDPDSREGAEIYKKNRERYAKEIQMVKAAIRQYGEQIEPKTLEVMQDVFYGITNSVKYSQSITHCSVARSLLSAGWHGIGPWQF